MQGGLELGVGLLYGARLGSNRPRDPVDGAQLVDDGTLDARDRVGLELDLPQRLEALDGIDQPDDPVAGQVGLVHVSWQADRHSAGHVLDHWCVVDDELIAQRPVPSLLVLGPQPVDAVTHRVNLRRQLSP